MNGKRDRSGTEMQALHKHSLVQPATSFTWKTPAFEWLTTLQMLGGPWPEV